MVKIQDFFTNMPRDLSKQTTHPTHHFFERFSSKHVNLARQVVLTSLLV